jgi:hypothetical protein
MNPPVVPRAYVASFEGQRGSAPGRRAHRRPSPPDPNGKELDNGWLF